MPNELDYQGQNEPFRHDSFSIYNVRPANEALRPIYSHPNGEPVFRHISEVIEQLSPEDIYELVVLYDVASVLEQHFIIDEEAGNVKFYILGDVDPLKTRANDGRVFGSAFGISSAAFSGGVSLGTVLELKVLLSDNSQSVGEFIDNLPLKSIGNNREERPIGVALLRDHLQSAMNEDVMQEDMDEIRYLIEKDYEDTAENLIGMVPFAKNGHEVTLMLKKAINLATAGGFEVDYEKVSKSLRKFHSLSLEGDLGKAREKLASYEKNSSSPLSPLGVEIIGLANNALESAEFLGEDTSFISSFFNILFPGMLANLEHDWNLIRRKGSYVDASELRQRYIHNRSMVIKWGKISEFDAEDIIGKMEIKPLSNN